MLLLVVEVGLPPPFLGIFSFILNNDDVAVVVVAPQLGTLACFVFTVVVDDEGGAWLLEAEGCCC